METVAFLLGIVAGWQWGYMWADARRQIREANVDYKTIDEVLSKVEWEGGLYDTAFSYGLSYKSIDAVAMPELREAWRVMEFAYEKFKPALDRVERILLEAEGE